MARVYTLIVVTNDRDYMHAKSNEDLIYNDCDHWHSNWECFTQQQIS